MKTKNALVIGAPYDEDDPYLTALQRMKAEVRTTTVVEGEAVILYDQNDQPLHRRRPVGFRRK